MQLDRLKSIRLGGWGKFFHRLFMFVTYPFRHIFKFLAFLLVAVVVLMAIPMSQGVSYRNVLDWYLFNYDEVKQKMPEMPILSEETVEKKPTPHKFKEFARPKMFAKKPEIKKGQADILPEAAEKSDGPNRFQKYLEKKKKYPKKVMPKVEKTAQPKVIIEEEIRPVPELEKKVEVIKPVVTQQIVPVEIVKPVAEKKILQDIPLPEEGYYRRDDSLPYVYEENPQTIKGRAIVFTANELSVGDSYVVLYGINTNPQKYDVQSAMEYLRELAEGKRLQCKIVAYSPDYIALGVCFLDGRSINQNMVDAGFADNIAL